MEPADQEKRKDWNRVGDGDGCLVSTWSSQLPVAPRKDEGVSLDAVRLDREDLDNFALTPKPHHNCQTDMTCATAPVGPPL